MLDFSKINEQDKELVIQQLAMTSSVNLQNFINTLGNMLIQVNKALPNEKEVSLLKNSFEMFLEKGNRKDQLQFLINFNQAVFPYSPKIMQKDLGYFLKLDYKRLGLCDENVKRIFIFKKYWENSSLTEKSKDSLCKFMIGLVGFAKLFYDERGIKLPETVV